MFIRFDTIPACGELTALLQLKQRAALPAVMNNETSNNEKTKKNVSVGELTWWCLLRDDRHLRNGVLAERGCEIEHHMWLGRMTEFISTWVEVLLLHSHFEQF